MAEVKLETIKPEFTPILLEILLETQEEVDAMYAISNAHISRFGDVFTKQPNKNVVGVKSAFDDISYSMYDVLENIVRAK